MIKNLNGNIFNSDANFILCETSFGIPMEIAEEFVHVEKEYNKYLKYCKKNHIEPTVQYVPVDVWALIMVDTLKNNDITAYDSDYKYVVNLFGQSMSSMGLQIDLKNIRNALIDIRNKAEKIGANIAVPYKMYGANWKTVYSIIEEIFDESDVIVEIWQ